MALISLAGTAKPTHKSSKMNFVFSHVLRAAQVRAKVMDTSLSPRLILAPTCKDQDAALQQVWVPKGLDGPQRCILLCALIVKALYILTESRKMPVLTNLRRMVLVVEELF